jgi:cyclophilin family peptidyl-prolyl cis-trans isomerase
MRLLQIFIMFTVVSASSCSFKKTDTAGVLPDSGKIEIQKLRTDISGLSTTYATIKTVHGDITFRFYTKAAPRTASRIIELIQSKFYDGLIFHRAIPNFIIQTGDPTGTGTDRGTNKLRPEFNEIQHIKGTIAMARGIEKDSADTQFYISLTTLPHLDGKNTVFGQVVEGLDVLPKLSKGDRILSITLNIKN